MHAYNKSFWCLYVVCTHSSIFVVPSSSDFKSFNTLDEELKLKKHALNIIRKVTTIDFSTAPTKGKDKMSVSTALQNESTWETVEGNLRWKPVNSLKNSQVTIQVFCSWSGKCFNVPEKPMMDNLMYETPQDPLLGSTSLQELIERSRKNISSLYLGNEVGGTVLMCGPHQVFQSEWETTMICDLICEKLGTNVGIPRIILQDGREAVVVTIGTPELIPNVEPELKKHCSSFDGNVYG